MPCVRVTRGPRGPPGERSAWPTRARGGLPGVPTQAGTEVETPGKGEIIINSPPDIKSPRPPSLLPWLWWIRSSNRTCLGQGCSNLKIVKGDVSCLLVLRWAVMDQNVLTWLFNVPLKPKTLLWELWGYQTERWPLCTSSAPAFGAFPPLALTSLHPGSHPCTLYISNMPQDGPRQYIFLCYRYYTDWQIPALFF